MFHQGDYIDFMFVEKYQKDGEYSNFKIKYMKAIQTTASASQIEDAAI